MPKTETYILNMGPQHPSTHGVLRVELTLDGERILKVTPHMGYLHRGIEKLMESRTYAQCLPYTDRLDYVSAMNNNWAFCQTVEKMTAIEIPERAEYIRVIMAELNRIASHLIFVGTLAIDLGASTGMIYAFREREHVLDLFDLVCGARMTFHYIRIGGVITDIQPEFIEKAYAFLEHVPEMLAEFNGLLSGNEIFQMRLRGTSKLTKEQALTFGVTGPTLRACGVDYDLRKVASYSVYDRFDFNVPLGENGDNWDRYQVRLREIQESAKIVRQALDALPTGEVMGKVPKLLRPPKGEIYHSVENTRGELGFYIVSDGSAKPYRVHIRRPSFINLQALNTLCTGMLIGDIVAVLSTIDPLMGEVDC